MVNMIKSSFPLKDSGQLTCAEYGDGDGFPILIQHGLIASIDDHDLFERLIQAGKHLICVARPGYGESSPHELHSYAEWADLMRPIVDSLALDHFDILAMSSGAPYGFSLGYFFPEIVRSIYIFSGIPALYDPIVLAAWPYEIKKNASMAEMQQLAQELFFSNLSDETVKNPDMHDSMKNNGFGVAQDLRLRSLDWGFSLSDLKAKVFIRHSKTDQSVPYQTAVRTAEMLPNCEFELTESGPHFSSKALDDFIQMTMLENTSMKN